MEMSKWHTGYQNQAEMVRGGAPGGQPKLCGTSFPFPAISLWLMPLQPRRTSSHSGKRKQIATFKSTTPTISIVTGLSESLKKFFNRLKFQSSFRFTAVLIRYRNFPYSLHCHSPSPRPLSTSHTRVVHVSQPTNLH